MIKTLKKRYKKSSKTKGTTCDGVPFLLTKRKKIFKIVIEKLRIIVII